MDSQAYKQETPPPPHPIMQEDNWAHRSSSMLCQTCMFWVIKDPLKRVNPLGRCRRRAPTLGGWPATFSQDWCGDHKLDETKI